MSPPQPDELQHSASHVVDPPGLIAHFRFEAIASSLFARLSVGSRAFPFAGLHARPFSADSAVLNAFPTSKGIKGFSFIKTKNAPATFSVASACVAIFVAALAGFAVGLVRKVNPCRWRARLETGEWPLRHAPSATALVGRKRWQPSLATILGRHPWPLSLAAILSCHPSPPSPDARPVGGEGPL